MSQALRNEGDAAEAVLRRDLAACYRLAAHFGWDDLIANHFSARLPGRDGAFLINPFGLLFEEITASSLLMVDLEGNLLEPSEYPVNQAGFVIHSAIYAARPEICSAMHVHSLDGVAVSATEGGLLPLNQTAMLIQADVACHEYEGVATELDERARLQADLGEHHLMLLRNHGTLAVGRSIAAAFYRLYVLETACTVQVRTLGMNAPLHAVPQPAVDQVAAGFSPAMAEQLADDVVWPALRRKADRLFPDYRD